MNGFVASLLSRSRGTADVVRPRLASLFEPGEPRESYLAGQPTLEQDVEEESSIDGPAVRPPLVTSPPPQALTSSQTFRSSQASPDERAAVTPGEADSRAAAVSLDRQVRPSATPALARGRVTMPVRRGDGAAHERSERAAAPASADERGERRMNALDGVRQRGTVLPPRGPTAARPPGSAAAAAILERGPLGRSDAVRAAASHHLPARATTAPAPTLLPAPAPRFRFEPPASRTRAVAADPIVEVSIGRIEVRAVFERGADRKVSTASPVMGLDEYLKTRASGGAP